MPKPSNAPDHIRQEGYLVKRAIRSGRNWKKRFFVLDNTTLWYFKTKDDSKPRGEIRITGDTNVKESSTKEFGMEINTPKQILIASALTKEDQLDWIDALTRAVQMARSRAAGGDPNAGDGKGGGFGNLIRRFSQQHRRKSSNLSEPSVGSVSSKVSNERSTEVTSSSSKARSRENATIPRDRHSFVASGTRFELDTRYTLMRPIGHGAYGVVISANDSETNEKVAIKKITRAFEDLVDAKRILREIKLLRHFDHENIIHIKDLLPPSSFRDYEDIYIVSELMETDLHRVIYSKQVLTNDHIQYFIYQILRALKYIHSANVIHRDLKPSNLLLNSNCDLKVCDFGLARGIEDDAGLELTEYVVTRWYRAPEIMLACREYTKAIDVWSVGCIFAELLGGRPLFPGDDYIHQLRIITDLLGTPPERDLQFIVSDKARRFMRNEPFKKKVSWKSMYPDASEDALDLLDKMMQFNPERRISVKEALLHPYLSALHHPQDEPEHDMLFDFDDSKPDDALEKRELQAQIAEEIFAFHPEERERFVEQTRSSRRR